MSEVITSFHINKTSGRKMIKYQCPTCKLLVGYTTEPSVPKIPEHCKACGTELKHKYTKEEYHFYGYIGM